MLAQSVALNLALVFSVLAQGNVPTLDDTLKWLTESLPVKATHKTTFVKDPVISGGTVTKVVSAEFMKCSAKVVTEEQITYTSRGKTTVGTTRWIYQIPIAKLNPSAISVVGEPVRGIGFETGKKANLVEEKMIKFVQGREVETKEGRGHSLVLPMLDKPTAEQFQKAFKQVITLCQQPKNKTL